MLDQCSVTAKSWGTAKSSGAAGYASAVQDSRTTLGTGIASGTQSDNQAVIKHEFGAENRVPL